jgi:sucrose-6-phosphate hydrolase SacC (GH32 family)
MINIDGVKVPIPEWRKGDTLKLQVFVDKQVVEVFINGGRYTVSRLVKESHIRGDRIALTRLGGHAALLSMKAWKLKTIN